MTRIVCVILVWLALVAVVHAHSAPSGTWSYGGACCSDRDCAPIPTERVQVTPDGYLVTLEPGDGTYVTKRMHRLFAYPSEGPEQFVVIGGKRIKRAMQGGDTEYHACVTPGGNLICLYVPPVGS